MAGRNGFTIAVGDAAHFAAPEPEDPELEDPDRPLTPIELARQQGEHFWEQLLARIPPREADCVRLYFQQGKRQEDIASIFGVTQAAVSYRLCRAISRIRFLLAVPIFEEEDIRRDLTAAFRLHRARTPHLELLDVNILVVMHRTTCQSETAQLLGTTQGRVRHRFFKLVARLKDMAAHEAKYQKYATFFSAIVERKAFNILRPVALPQWAHKGQNKGWKAHHKALVGSV